MKVTKQLIMDKQNISEDLVHLIKQQILDGELNPGDRIIETQFARELGISQTPVREAIRQLSGEGIVTIVPNRGPMVRAFHMQDVYEIYSLRAVIEGLAIRLAIQNASEQDVKDLQIFYEEMKEKLANDSVDSLLEESVYVHQTIIRLSNHQRLIHMYKTMSFQIALCGRVLGSTSTKQKEVDQHGELIDALVRRDPDYGETVMRNHVHRSYREFAELKETEPKEFDEKAWF